MPIPRGLDVFHSPEFVHHITHDIIELRGFRFRPRLFRQLFRSDNRLQPEIDSRHTGDHHRHSYGNEL